MARAKKKRSKRGGRSLIGTTIQKRYHVVRLLGDGGMGSVYKAADQVLRRFVAIKMLHPATAENPSAVERFVREARSSAAIGHPNIIDILDFGYEEGAPFLVMEYLRGRSLSEAIAEERRLSMARACNIATHGLAGLSAAHDRGILHRDLKPANMMLIAQLGDRDFVKLCDFGFAALVRPTTRIDGGKSLTPARTLVGTPAYAAPERLQGDDRRDPRLDVYSIGVVLFEMLAGRRPFDAPTFQVLARKVRTEKPPSLSAIADVPRGLDRVVQKALAKNRDDRWRSAKDFAEALVPFGGRVLPAVDDCPSDSFTMDLLRLRARETQQRTESDVEGDPMMGDLKKRFREERALREMPAASDFTDESTRTTPSQARRKLERQKQVNKPKRRVLKPRNRPVPAPPPRPIPNHDGGMDESTDVLSAKVRTELLADPVGDTATSDRAFIGSVSLSVLRFVSRRFGERALTDLLGSLPQVVRDVFDVGVGDDSWVPYEAHNALVQHVDAKLGRDDLHLVVQCGRAAAESAFERMRALRPPSPPPELLLTEFPTILSELTQGLHLRVTRVGPGYARLELAETGEVSLTTSVFLIGFFDRALDRFGASDVEVNLTSTPALGDPDCVYEISWIV